MHFEKDYLVLDDTDKIYENKISSSRYSTLIGANDFQKPGDALLEMWKLIPKEPFDPFYTLRGEIAEQLVKHRLDENKAKYKYFGMSASENKIFDLFTKNQCFGGVYDFLLKNRDGTLTNLEVKSMSLKNKPYMKIARKEHIKQVQLTSYLGNIKSCRIVYVFFDDESEERIKEWSKEPGVLHNIFSLNYEIKTFVVDINEKDIERDMVIVCDLVKECKKNRRIPIHLISDNILEKLGYKPNIFERTTIDYD